MAPASTRAEGEISAESRTGVTGAAASAPRVAGVGGVAAPPLGPEAGALPDGVLVLGVLGGGVLGLGVLVRGALLLGAVAVDNLELL